MKFSTIAVTSLALAAATPAEAQRRLAPETWFSSADYPADAVEAGEAGMVRVAFTITPEGRASECRVEHATAPRRLAQTTCALIVERARYAPRHGKSSGAVSGRDLISIDWTVDPVAVAIGSPTDFGGALPIGSPSQWVLQPDYPSRLLRSRTLRAAVSFEIGTAGRIVRCGGAPSSENTEVDRYTCQVLAARARFDMPRDELGEPIATTGRTAILWAPAR